MKYYSTKAIDQRHATYNVVFGERSNGKTYALLKKTLGEYFKTGAQVAYVRRWQEDVTPRRMSVLYAGLAANGEVAKLSDGKFTGVHYQGGKFYACNYDDNGKAVYGDQDVIGFAFALSNVEHDKSTSYPGVKTIVFDEFLSNRTYLPDEFVLFMNLVSTIVRQRDDVAIYMLGNTVNKYCPYFTEMGLVNITTMKQGTIDVYRYGTSTLTVAVEYCANGEAKKQSNKYFAFNNPKLEMITGGAWEMAIYPHLPYKYKPRDVALTYFIEFDARVFQCEVVEMDGIYFTYIHVKTTPLKDTENDLIYSLDYNPRLNYNRSVYKPTSKAQERVLWFFKTDRVFYQNNEVGDAIKNYLTICKRG